MNPNSSDELLRSNTIVGGSPIAKVDQSTSDIQMAVSNSANQNENNEQERNKNDKDNKGDNGIIALIESTSNIVGMEAKRVKLNNRVNAISKRLTMTQAEHATLKHSITLKEQAIRIAKDQISRLEKQIKLDTGSLNQLNINLKEVDVQCSQLVSRNDKLKQALIELDNVILYKVLNEDVEAFLEIFNKEPICELSDSMKSILNKRKQIKLKQAQKTSSTMGNNSSTSDQANNGGKYVVSLNNPSTQVRRKTLFDESGVSIPQIHGYKSRLPPLPSNNSSEIRKTIVTPPSTSTNTTTSTSTNNTRNTTTVENINNANITTEVNVTESQMKPVITTAADLPYQPTTNPSYRAQMGQNPYSMMGNNPARKRIPVRTKSTILKDDPYFKYVQNKINEELKLQELAQLAQLEQSGTGAFTQVIVNPLYCLKPLPSFKYIQGSTLVYKYLSDRVHYGENTTYKVPDKIDELYDNNIDTRDITVTSMDHQFSMSTSNSITSATPIEVYDEFADPLLWNDTDLPDDPVLLKAMIGKLQTACLTWKNRFAEQQQLITRNVNNDQSR